MVDPVGVALRSLRIRLSSLQAGVVARKTIQVFLPARNAPFVASPAGRANPFNVQAKVPQIKKARHFRDRLFQFGGFETVWFEFNYLSTTFGYCSQTH